VSDSSAHRTELQLTDAARSGFCAMQTVFIFTETFWQPINVTLSPTPFIYLFIFKRESTHCSVLGRDFRAVRCRGPFGVGFTPDFLKS
jgi:hypothetical protein